MKHTLLTIFSFCVLAGYAQEPLVDSIPFHLDKLLLVFKGTVNGVETDFAFDTGAAFSVSNSSVNEQTNIRSAGGKRGIRDANKQTARIENIVLEDVGIGSFHITNTQATTYDMPFLQCGNLLLLGADIIKKFNWKIDFQKKLVYVSRSGFVPDENMQVWKVSYRSNRPFIPFSIHGKTYQNCLIDFGFNGIFDINTHIEEANRIYEQKLQQNKVNQYINATMGLTGLGKPVQTDQFLIDSMYFNGTLIRNIKASRTADIDTKIGIRFFNDFCRQMILNYSVNTFYISLSPRPLAPEPPLDIRIHIKNGNFVVYSKNYSNNSSAFNLQIDEEVKSVNGKRVADFKNECDYLIWSYLYRENSLVVEKLNGEKVLVKRSSVFEN